jgi:hypothetical protein
MQIRRVTAYGTSSVQDHFQNKRMTYLFMMWIDLFGIFVTLFLLTGFGLGLFFFCRYILIRIFERLSEKRIVLLSILSVWILTPVVFILLYLLLIYFTSVSDNLTSQECRLIHERQSAAFTMESFY